MHMVGTANHNASAVSCCSAGVPDSPCSTDRSAGAELRRATRQCGCKSGNVNAKAKQRHCCERGNPRLFYTDLAWAGIGLTDSSHTGGELTKQAYRQAREVLRLIDQGLGLVVELLNLIVDLLQCAGGRQHVLGIVRCVEDRLLPRCRYCAHQSRDGQKMTDA
jgi:hypothetical protein